MTERQSDQTSNDGPMGGNVTTLTPDGPLVSLEKKGCEKHGSREDCYKLQRQADTHPETLIIEAFWPNKKTVGGGDKKRTVLEPDFGMPRSASITFDSMLVRRAMAWPDLRWRVLMALVMQTRPMTRRDVTVHADVNEVGDITLTKDAAQGRCKTTIPSDPYRVRDASAENLMRLMQPNDGHVAHKMQLLVEQGGFDVDPTVFNPSRGSAPTVDLISSELAALQAEGLVSSLAPDSSALLNPAVIFNGNPALRSLVSTAVRPAEGDTFSVDPANAVEPNPDAPDGHWKSGDKKSVNVKQLKRELAEVRRERKATDALNERQALRLYETLQENAKLIEQGLRDAIEIEALRTERNDAQARVDAILPLFDGVVNVVADVPDGVSIDASKTSKRAKL